MKKKEQVETEVLVGFENKRATYVHSVGKIANISCLDVDNYSGSYEVRTKDGRTIGIGGKPAFIFLTGLGVSDLGAVDDPEVIAPIIRMIIHAEEYLNRLNGAPIDLPLFPSRRAALDYLHQAQVHALGDTWEGFDVDDRHYPDPEWCARLRKMGL